MPTNFDDDNDDNENYFLSFNLIFFLSLLQFQIFIPPGVVHSTLPQH